MGYESLSEQIVGGTRAAMGEAAFATAWASGRRLSVEQAIELAMEEPIPYEHRTFLASVGSDGALSLDAGDA
jgi:hypothetical protein